MLIETRNGKLEVMDRVDDPVMMGAAIAGLAFGASVNWMAH